MSESFNFKPTAIGVNGTSLVKSPMLAGFICVTSGTLTVTSAAGVVLLNLFPVTAGTSHPFSMYVGQEGCTVVLAGGASGTICT